MSLIKQFNQKDHTQKRLHPERRGTFSTFERDGAKFIQLVTYGHGGNPNKQSQTIQLDREGALDLYRILGKTFGF